MSQEFRHLRCSGCTKVLRLSISEKVFGKKIEVTCPVCSAKCRTTIPFPPTKKIETREPPESSSEMPDSYRKMLEGIFGKF